MRVLLRLCLIAWLGTGSAFAAPDLDAVVKELVKIQATARQRNLACWLPYEAILVLAKALADVPDLEKQVAGLERYTFVAVEIGRDAGQGNARFLSESQLRAAAGLACEGRQALLRPLSPTDLPKDILPLAEALKDGIAEGPSKETTHLLVFSAVGGNGEPTLRATRPGKLTLRIPALDGCEAVTFTWRTPLNSLVENQPCRGCGESLLAVWRYCPQCGAAVAP